jgi:dihydrofolate reductase
MYKKKCFSIVAGVCKKNYGIGFQGDLPWKHPEDLKYFKKITTMRMNEKLLNAVIMGRKTLESLKGKILPNRINVCITSGNVADERILVFKSLDEALKSLYRDPIIENIFVIGGAALYECAINHEDCDEILINEINNDVFCDTFFPQINSDRYVLADTSKIADDIENKRYILKRDRFFTL